MVRVNKNLAVCAVTLIVYSTVVGQPAQDNHPPVADAGPNQTLIASENGTALVSLNGGGSYDPENQSLTFEWYWYLSGQKIETTDTSPRITLPTGRYFVSLTVSDGELRSAYDTAFITVLAFGPGGYSGGVGTPDDPYQIAAAQDLITLGDRIQDYHSHFILTDDIDLDPDLPGGQVFERAVIRSSHIIEFTGNLNGQGHVINNLTIRSNIEGQHYLGLIGYIKGGSFENLGIINCSISAGPSSSRIGSLCGTNDGGHIKNCYSTGTIVAEGGSNYIGGLCGRNCDGTVEDCYSSCDVSGGYALGGLCGDNFLGFSDKGEALISDCYSTGNISGSDYSYGIGGLCGTVSRGTITASYSTGDVLGGDSAYELGGLIGSCRGIIKDCYATGNVIGGDDSNDLGGLGGENHGRITNCCSRGDVLGGARSYDLGGLCGTNRGSLSGCFSTGAVTGGDGSHYLGGLIGGNRGGVAFECFSSSSVSGDNTLGGLCGYSSPEKTPLDVYYSIIANSFSTGIVSGKNTVAGFCALNEGTIANSYAAAQVTDPDESSYGFCGNAQNSGPVIWCFWDVNVSGVDVKDPRQDAAIGLTTDDMKKESTYINADWDFIDESDNGTRDIWQIRPGEYATHWHPFSGGTGMLGDPYQVANADDLIYVRGYSEYWDRHFVLVRDIDLEGLSLSVDHLFSVPNPDQPYSFSGTFDGNGHTIADLTTPLDGSGNPAADFGGLFSELTGVVRNLGVINCSVSGDRAGGICAMNSGTISNCYVTGASSAYWSAGGICATNFGTINNCYATGASSGRSAGGFCGSNTGEISNCYSTGRASGRSAGGFCSANTGRITHCYAAGEPRSWTRHPGESGVDGVAAGFSWAGETSEFVDCFYDVDVSGTGVADVNPTGIIDKTTLQMQTRTTYTDAGWDFVDETENGTEDIWQIRDGQYPTHAWVRSYYKGSGVAGDPYQLATADDLLYLGSHPEYWDRHFELVSDIDLEGLDYKVIGPNDVQLFAGVFNGSGHCIRNLTISDPDTDWIGLFGVTDPNAVIKNLTLVNCAVDGKNRVGALAGTNQGRVLNCSSTGSVSGKGSVGGLLGENRGELTACYGWAGIRGTSIVGGLVGYLVGEGTITNCYYVGEVFAQAPKGELFGYNGTDAGNDSIVNSYPESNLPESSEGYAGWDFEDTWLWEPDVKPYPVFKSQRITLADPSTPIYQWQIEAWEDFEHGLGLDWNAAGDGSWTITGDEARTGDFCARASEPSGTGTSSVLQFDRFCPNGYIRFSVKTNSQEDLDRLVFSIDGNTNINDQQWSGQQPWQDVSFKVEEGSHTFRWEYMKHSGNLGESDTAWIDDVMIVAE